jgi:cell division protein FtsL
MKKDTLEDMNYKELSLFANWQLPLLVVLFVAVVFVSIKTVAYRHESRAQFMQLQKLEKERDVLAAQWSRLKLEQSTMLNQVRVERLARWDLKMQIPKVSEMKMIRERAPVVLEALPVMSAAPQVSSVEAGE